MNFLDEFDSLVTKELGMTFMEYRFINIGGKFFYVEGHNGINILTKKEISFKIKKKTLSVYGDEMIIKYYDNSTAIIEGKIFRTEVF